MAPRSTLRRRALLGLEGFVVIGALVGTVGLLIDGDAFMGRTVVEADIPLHRWWIAALALLVADAVMPAVAMIAELQRRPWADRAHLTAGLVMIGWIVLQLVVIGLVFFLQPLILVIGVMLVVLALAPG